MEVRGNSSSRSRRRCRPRGSFSWKRDLCGVDFIVPSPEQSLEVLSTSGYSSCSCHSALSLNSSLPDNNSLCSDHGWTSDSEVVENNPRGETNTRRTRTLQHQNVTVIIPEDNLSCYSRGDFYLNIIDDPRFEPPTDSRTFHVSRIVSVGPHKATFYRDKPALIYLPLTKKIEPDDRLLCLCSNTPNDTEPVWEAMPTNTYSLKNGRVVIKAHHFSLFTVVVEKQYPEASRVITPAGATLQLAEVQGVEVQFPKDALNQNVTAFVRVLYDFQYKNSISRDEVDYALASPVVMVGPHGCVFRPDSPPVMVCLPIPHYKEIRNTFGSKIRLSIWQSCTKEDEPCRWEKMDQSGRLEQRPGGLYILSFPVSHFSFFKVLWDILASSLHEAKMGVAYFYPFISFSMMCQAWMEENKDTQRFGLEVICYRSDNKVPENTNYRHKVGRSLRPKLVRPGCIIIRLKSELFEADIDAGEDVAMTKKEPDFRGREFEKQFACRFKQGKPNVDRGTFGKVVVEREINEGNNEPLFEFNLNKTGIEAELPMVEATDRWAVVAIQELASSLHILEDQNWKKFARHIGFTKNEIKSKLLYTADPFRAMVNLYQSRDGTPEEFVQALYAVSRQLQLGQLENSSQPSSGGESSGSGSGTKGPTDRQPSDGGSPQGSTSSKEREIVKATTPRRWLSLLTPSRWRSNDKEEDSDDESETTEPSTSSRKRSRSTNSREKAAAAAKRRRFSDISETMSSSEESSIYDENRLLTKHKLTDSNLWSISKLMNTINWRALGRTLGLEESILMNIEHAFKSRGFGECAYQMLLEWKGRRPQECNSKTLHEALLKEKMNSVARQLSVMKLGEMVSRVDI